MRLQTEMSPPVPAELIRPEDQMKIMKENIPGGRSLRFVRVASWLCLQSSQPGENASFVLL